MDSKGIDFPGHGPPLLTQINFDRREIPAVQPVAETGKGIFREIDLGDRPPTHRASTFTPGEKKARLAVDILTEHLDTKMNLEVTWTVKENSGMLVVEVRDKTTGDVLRQLPPDEILSAAGNPSFDPNGLLFNKMA